MAQHADKPIFLSGTRVPRCHCLVPLFHLRFAIEIETQQLLLTLQLPAATAPCYCERWLRNEYEACLYVSEKGGKRRE